MSKMNIKIYQVDMDRDKNNVAFMRLESLERFQGSSQVQSDIYNKVFEGEVDCKSLDDVYQMFNLNHPADFCGHSLSVSDVVEVVSSSNIVGKIDYLKTGMSSVYTDFVEYTQAQERLREENVEFKAHNYDDVQVPVVEKGFYFCDSFGFKNVDFEPEKAGKIPDAMKVVLLEPGKVAKITEISGSLKGMQRVVAGDIEPFYPFEDKACIIVNDEGKMRGLDFNRGVYDENKKLVDILAGNAFICGVGTDDFCSLSDEQLSKYQKIFEFPERFFKINDQIKGIKYNPSQPSLNERIAESSAKSKQSKDTSRVVPDRDVR